MITESDKKLFEAAQEFSRKGQYKKMINTLEVLIGRHPNKTVFRGSFAWGLWELGEIDRAIQEFESCVKLSPNSESFSLNLFNSYWSVGRTTEALAEMDRFQSVSSSDDYESIKLELGEKGLLK